MGVVIWRLDRRDIYPNIRAGKWEPLRLHDGSYRAWNHRRDARRRMEALTRRWGDRYEYRISVVVV